MKRTYIALLIFIISAFIFYFFILPSINVSQFFESFRSIDIYIYCAAILAVIFSIILASLRWSILMSEVKADKSKQLINSLGIFSFGLMAGLVVPSRVGSYAKVPMVKKMDNIWSGACLSAVNAETILDLFYICSAGVVSFFIIFPLFSGALIISILVVVIFFTVTLVIYLKMERSNLISETLPKLLSEINQNTWIIRITKSIRMLLSLVKSTKDIFIDRKTVFNLISLTIVTQIFGVVALYLVIRSVHALISPLEVFAILTISYVIGIISLIPGGLGVSDISLIILLEREGIDIAVATNVAILWRFCMYFPVALIIIAFAIQKKITNKKNNGVILEP